MGFNLFDLLLPRETKFFTYMVQQAEILCEATLIFKELVERMPELNEEGIKQKITAIKECESRGDEVEMAVIDALHKTLITPLDREDIHLIVMNVDKSLDILNSITQQILVYQIRSFTPQVNRFAELIVEIGSELKTLMGLLKNRSSIKPIIHNMHEIEMKTDAHFHTSMAELFSGPHSPVEIIKYKEIYEHLEYIVDYIDFVGKLVRGVVVKQG
jgi:uncharacterized protein